MSSNRKLLLSLTGLLAALTLLLLPGTAGAQYGTDGPNQSPTDVSGTGEENDPGTTDGTGTGSDDGSGGGSTGGSSADPTSAEVGSDTDAAGEDGLPATGSWRTGELAAIGLALLAVGGLTIYGVGRRRTA